GVSLVCLAPASGGVRGLGKRAKGCAGRLFRASVAPRVSLLWAQPPPRRLPRFAGPVCLGASEQIFAGHLARGAAAGGSLAASSRTGVCPRLESGPLAAAALRKGSVSPVGT